LWHFSPLVLPRISVCMFYSIIIIIIIMLLLTWMWARAYVLQNSAG
jgi:hypothetical protein